VYDYRHDQRAQERALEAYRLCQLGHAGAAAASDASAGEGELAGAPPPAAAAPPPPPEGGRLAAAAPRAPRALPAALGGGGGGGGALVLGPPPPRAAPRALAGGLFSAIGRLPPSRQQPPARAASAAAAYVTVRRPHGTSLEEEGPPAQRLRVGGGANGRPRAQPVASITAAELDQLLKLPPAAWRRAYCLLYDVEQCSSGNLPWLQQRLRDAVRDAAAVAVQEEEE